MTPADELRAASTRLRTIATAAGGDTWHADHFPEGTIVRRAGSTRSLFRLAADGNRAAGTPYVLPAIGDQIAVMHPGVGAALADWLDYEADLMGPGSERRGRTTHALAVARAINNPQP